MKRNKAGEPEFTYLLIPACCLKEIRIRTSETEHAC